MRPSKKETRTEKRLPYRKPKLIVHGDLRSITLTKAGHSGDGGKPATRTTGSPG